ncbi:Alkanesulfonates transport system permease protein [Caballeronia glathei]|jgi:NitT/TauT family transport system permease protein|uniref:ABC transporter permease n=1 Tax=Caballeronia glathei TaxID=60547 RepID=A0A069PMT4_9BURK|nr:MULTISPECIES: ABC transporter permease [Burkholderiaceae]KDR41925.1 ABC transporter permease [Caballeronia glathei]TCK36645.1 NitT/TauT family transport system permease protein [Paraburkholderia sp. BL8N3]CDY77111.1 Alkanesulfonates transport system permease protein [Caballeronia glathei]
MRAIALDPRNRLLVLVTRFALLAGGILLWWILTSRGWISAFFFGDPVGVARRIAGWFVTGSVYTHLYTTLVETILAFLIGTVLGLACGLWLALNPFLAVVTDPFIKAMNSMPRLIFAPIFALWFGLGIWSKVALGVTLVFFVVFFNVFQGVREVSPAVLANTRMLGANSRELMRHVYLPSAMSWVFSSLHNAVGIAFVGSVVGEYLGSEKGVGYLILLAEGVFDINSVIAGILLLTVFALVLDTTVSLVEDHFMRWQPSAGQTVSGHA